jgi:microcystin-dependent protein
MAIEKYELPLKEVIPINEGGTGATTPEQARENLGIDNLPVGTIIPYAGDTPPTGFNDCSGAEINRNTYSRLYDVIGTKYGAGNGSTTFNLPNLNNGSFLEGSNTAGTVKSAGLPNVNATLQTPRARFGDANMGGTQDALEYLHNDLVVGTFSGSPVNVNCSSGIRLDLSKSNSIYGASDTVQPKSVTIKFCIKY